MRLVWRSSRSFAKWRDAKPWRGHAKAVRAIANVGGEEAIDVLVEVLDDPFWRVRYAAIQALRDRPAIARDLAIQNAPRTARRDAALALPGERDAESTKDATSKNADPPRADMLDDEDPAVVAVELAKASDDALSPARLVSFLQSPHDVLRRAAQKRVLDRSREEDVSAAIALLDDPRVPYVDDAVRAVLARASTRAARERILRERASRAPSALAWCIVECAHGGDADFAVDECFASANVLVWRAAVVSSNAFSIASLASALEDSDVDVRAFAAHALAQRTDGIDALAAHDFSRDPPRVVRAALSGDGAPRPSGRRRA